MTSGGAWSAQNLPERLEDLDDIRWVDQNLLLVIRKAEICAGASLEVQYPGTGLTSERGRATTERESQECFWGATKKKPMNREALIRQIERVMYDATGQYYPVDLAGLSDGRLEEFVLLLRELKGESEAVWRCACETIFQKAKAQECFCFGPPVDDCPTHGSRATKLRRR